MRKFLIYIICGLMVIGICLPAKVKAADANEDMVTISFEGKYTDGKSMQVKKGHELYPYQVENVLKRIGYSIDDIYIDKELKTPFKSPMVINEDISLYPKISIKKYRISFNTKKAGEILHGFLTLKDQYAIIGETNLSEFVPMFLEEFNNRKTQIKNPKTNKIYSWGEVYEIVNYEINGFKFNSIDDIGTLEEKHIQGVNISSVIITANITNRTYHIRFDTDGANNDEKFPPMPVRFRRIPIKPSDIPTKTGYKFLGWYEGDEEFLFNKVIYEDTYLKAKWEKVNPEKYTVKFVLEGEEISSQEVEFDSQAKEPTIETKEGFEFDGWYTDSKFTKKFNFSSPVKSNLNLYARWNKIEKENPNPDEKEEPGENPNPDDNKNPGETEEPGKNPDQNPGEDQEPGDDKDTDENPDEDKDPDESEEPGNNPDEKEKPGETEQPDDDEKENPDQDKNPDDNKESDDQKNPDVKDNPNKYDRPSYDYKYDYYDYYKYPNYDYLNSNRNNSSDIAKNKDDKAEGKTKDESKDEIIEEKVTIPEAILNSYFSDIGDLPGDYQEAIIDLANRSVLIGTGKNNFDPHTSISRAMVAQVLYRLANDKAYLNPSDFTDSAPTNWFYTAVNWANEKGLVEGFKDKTFKPNKSITNEELAVILARAIEKLELKTSKINSIDKGDYKFLADWNRDGIIKMLELDLMDFTFENNQVVVKEISRAEFANIIYKLINSLN